jgi:hypothetical protein
VADAVAGTLAGTASGHPVGTSAGAVIASAFASIAAVPGVAAVAGATLANYALIVGMDETLMGPGVAAFGLSLGQSAAIGVCAAEFVSGHTLVARAAA